MSAPVRLRRGVLAACGAALGLALLLWSLLPVYNMLLIALDPEEGETEFAGLIWQSAPSLEGFRTVLAGDYWYLDRFWQKFGHSCAIGLGTMLATVVIGSLASFALGRMRLGKARRLGALPLATYAVPASFLVIPYYRVMHAYGLADTLWAVIAADIAFATPYAILILLQYAKLIPQEVDEAARVDGAAPFQIYLRIYLPLMAPALVAVAIYALLLAWNEYLYQYLLLPSSRYTTVAVAIAQFFDADEAPWNDMMAAALLYALPPIVIFYALRRWFMAGLTLSR